VTEASPVAPQTARGKRRLDAEQALLRWSEQQRVPVAILRVPGIYGPDRLPVERIRSGQPILREQDAPFTNRIHADDLAMICVVAAERAPAGAIYNVSDGQPGNMSQYFKDVADALGLPHPPEVSREEAEKVLSAGMLSYLNESRRISNQKILSQLGVQLKYPNLATGLAALPESSGNSPDAVPDTTPCSGTPGQ
jgi:nucleoside-diphosphate-sugar epimerase